MKHKFTPGTVEYERLRDAAPELFEALEAAEKIMTMTNYKLYENTIKAARAALSKATGGAK